MGTRDTTTRSETTDRGHTEPVDDGSHYTGIARIPAARRWLRRRLAAAERRGDRNEVRSIRRKLGMK